MGETINILTMSEESLAKTDIRVMIDELYKHPVTSFKHKKIREAIQLKLTDKKYDEYLICFPSRMHFNYSQIPVKEWLEDFNWVNGVLNYPDEYSLVGVNYKLFSSDQTFTEDSRFSYTRRRDLEYNLEYKQLVVCAYITDGEHIILLHTHKDGDTRIQDKYTMIQGHVDFTPEAYLMSQHDFLRFNIAREFVEEIKTDEKVYFPSTPKYMVNMKTNHISLEHIGVVYELEVENAKDFYEKVNTGETHKHSVSIIPLNVLEYMGPEVFDEWTYAIMKKIVDDRKI